MHSTFLARALGLFALSTGAAFAADHAEAPGAAADPAADIADFYAWHTDDGKVVLVLTVAPLSTTSATWDPDVLYGVHVDTDLDNAPDADVWLRLGQNTAGDWGVQAILGDTVEEGPVETTFGGDELTVWAGLRDDPFFFDLTGFQTTLATGTLSFTAADTLAGLNVTAFVVEVDQDALFGDASQVQLWATTARK